MKQGSLGWITPILAVMLPLLGLAGCELLQWHRFTTEADRLQVALGRFADTTVYSGEDGKPLPTASGRTSLPFFKVDTSGLGDWRLRERTWKIAAVFADSQGRWFPLRADILLHQHRRLLMRGPELFVGFGSQDNGFSRLLGKALADFDYQTAEH